MMKTKFLFTMCAATLLAGCANEEFLSTPETNIDNRAKVEVNLSATMGQYSADGASTRTIWENGTYMWENGDKIGACIVDATGTITYNNIASNYPFTIKGAITTPVEAASFETNTAVYEGTYVFYHGYKGDMTAGKTMKVNFPVTQVVDAENPLAHLTKDNFFVSPLIKIKGGIAYEAANSIPVQFTSLYSGFAPSLKNTSGKEVKVSKIEISTTSTFKIGDDINTIATLFGGAVIDNDDAELAKKIETARNAMRAQSVDLYQSAKTATSVSLELPETVVAAGAELSVRMLFPAGSYAQGELTMKVFTDQGVSEIAVNAKSGALEFNRDEFRTGSFEMPNFEFPTDFTISNESDWNYAVKFIGDNLKHYANNVAKFSLTKDVTLTKDAAVADFSILVVPTTNETLTLEGGEFSFGAKSYIGSLVVAEDATLNLDGSSFINTLVNNGTVNVLAKSTVKSIAATAYAGWTNAVNGIATLTNNDKATIVVDGTLQLGTVAPTLAAGSTITNNGTLAIIANAPNAGLITNNGKLTALASTVLTNTGKIDLGAACTVQSLNSSSAAAVIVNNDANALITLATIKDVFVDADGEATDTPLVTNTNGAVSVAITPSSSLADLANIQEVNSATISGSWKKADVDKVDLAATIEGLILNNATVDIKDAANDISFANITSVKVMGANNTITNSGTSLLTFAQSATTLTIDKDAKLVVAKNVLFGKPDVDGATATISVQGELDITGAVVGIITVGADKNGNTPANTDAKVVINEDGFLTAAKVLANSQTNFTNTDNPISNYGTIVNNGTFNAVGVENKVPGKSVFQGNITDDQGDYTLVEAGFAAP